DLRERLRHDQQDADAQPERSDGPDCHALVRGRGGPVRGGGLMLKLQPDPTFRAKVGIPVPGGATTEIEVECKHITKDALEPKLKELTDDQFAAEVVVGWSGVDEAFSAE